MRSKISEFAELPPVAKSVWRHYYKKLKKQTRGGKLSKHLDGYLPGDSNAAKLGVLYRGTNKQEVEKLAQGRFKSLWGGQPERQNGVIVKPSRNATWVASNPRMAATYAARDEARMVVVAPSVLRRKDKILTRQIGARTTTAPIRGGIAKDEARLLKGEAFSPQRWNTRGVKKWKPVPLGEIQRREFGVLEIRPGMIEFGSSGLMRQARRLAVRARSNRPEDLIPALNAARRIEEKQKSGWIRTRGNWEKMRLAEANEARVSSFLARLGLRQPKG